MTNTPENIMYNNHPNAKPNNFKNFNLATYIRAYEIESMSADEFEAVLDSFISQIHTDKIYVENHRGLCTIPVPKLKEVKEMIEKRGIKAAGGITCTSLVNGIRKPSIFDTYCYTDPSHRAEYLKLISELSSVFDEIILDDFFFTACRCEMCIEAKGKLSWKDYRLKLMEEFSKEAVDTAKRINPNVTFVIKYPNWYESYQETGFNPSKQIDIFDGIYTGTETRTPYSQQHLQRYESYSIMRLMEHAAPMRNGGGWIDPFGSENNMNYLIEQAQATLYGKAKELTLWNMIMFENLDSLPALNKALCRIDKELSLMGNPVGVATYEPFNADGEDQLYNYLGMCGITIDPSPNFDENATTILFTQSSAEDETSITKLEKFVRNGGNAIVTTGYFRKMYDKGIKDFTSTRLTNRHVIGKRYMIQNANSFNTVLDIEGRSDILFEILSYKTNATHSDISLVADEHNFPIMTEDNYGKGRFFILNVPENYADLYKLPMEVIRNISKHLSMGQKVYIGGEPKFSLYAYDNDTYALVSYSEVAKEVQIIVRGDVTYLTDLSTGKTYEEKYLLPRPNHMEDAVTEFPEEKEYAFPVQMYPGNTLMFTIK